MDNFDRERDYKFNNVSAKNGKKANIPDEDEMLRYLDEYAAEEKTDSKSQPEEPRDIYSSKRAERESKNVFVKKFRDLKRSFTVDFEKPLSISDQAIIMTVILTVSCLLFSGVYLFGLIVHAGDNEAETGAQAVSSETEASADLSDVSEEKSLQPSEPVSESAESSEASDQSSGVESSVSEAESSEEESSEPSKPYEEPVFVKETVDSSLKSYGKLILVDKKNPCAYNGENVIPVIDNKSDTYGVLGSSVELDRDIIEPLNNMMDDFASYFGYTDIFIASGYRSYSQQEGLYNQELYEKGEDGEMWVAPPGYSEHQTGLAFDFNLLNEDGGIAYNGDGAYSWLNMNCYRYGFIVRYLEYKEDITGYDYEPWHFRYVGVPAATYITRNGLVLEEYIETVSTYTPENPLYIQGDFGENWLVYSVKDTEGGSASVSVPDGVKYDISGNNCDGFIVTVYLDESTDPSETAEHAE